MNSISGGERIGAGRSGGGRRGGGGADGTEDLVGTNGSGRSRDVDIDGWGWGEGIRAGRMESRSGSGDRIWGGGRTGSGGG